MSTAIKNLPTIVKDLNQFHQFLIGGKTDELEQHMAVYKQHLSLLNRNYHEKSWMNNEIRAGILQLFQDLNIAKEEQQKYLDRGYTLYELLLKLNRVGYRKGYTQISYILELIDDQSLTKKLIKAAIIAFIILLIVAIALALAIVFSPAFLEYLGIGLNFLLSATIAGPIINLISTVLVAGIFFALNLADESMPLNSRLSNNFFLTVRAGYDSSAALVWMFNPLHLISPLSAGLFIAGALVDVLKEAYFLYRHEHRHDNPDALTESTPLLEHQEYARREFSYRKHRNALIINLCIAILLVCVVAAAFVAPLLFPVIAGIIAKVTTFALVGLTSLRFYLNKKNDERFREELQQELEIIERAHVKAALTKSPVEAPAETCDDVFVNNRVVSMEEVHVETVEPLVSTILAKVGKFSQRKKNDPDSSNDLTKEYAFSTSKLDLGPT